MIRNFRFDWRWGALILFIAVLANTRSLPWPVPALALALGAAFFFNIAWSAWGGGGGRRPGSTTRVTYWRGQRIETRNAAPRLQPGDFGTLVPVLLYGGVGLALALAALALTLRGLGAV